ncbi:MAG: hypothetical protein FJW39_34320 [Acidobacteria bacterium]|nr:hypothetical protein [Acidobacteriota bacterium]
MVFWEKASAFNRDPFKLRNLRLDLTAKVNSCRGHSSTPIHSQRTGEDIFAAFAARLARPVGMQDFAVADGKYVHARVSDHPAYHFDLSARDLVRFGWLYLNRGNWNGRQLVPATWVDESTRVISEVDAGIGYGYMW